MSSIFQLFSIKFLIFSFYAFSRGKSGVEYISLYIIYIGFVNHPSGNSSVNFAMLIATTLGRVAPLLSLRDIFPVSSGTFTLQGKARLCNNKISLRVDGYNAVGADYSFDFIAMPAVFVFDFGFPFRFRSVIFYGSDRAIFERSSVYSL